MKKVILLCALGVFMVGLLSASPAAAFSFLGGAGKDILDNGSNPTEEGNWLETLPGISSPVTFTFKNDPINWDASFDYGSGTYVILKTGNMGEITDDRWFAFRIDLGDSFSDYNQLYSAMITLLQTQYQTTATNWKASHFSVFNGSQVPIPAAAWLLGSGLVGLVGIRMRRRRG